MPTPLTASTTLALALLLASTLCLPTAQAQPEEDPMAMAGNRFRTLSVNEMTPAQRTLADSILAGPRTSLGGPFNVLLRSPDLGERVQHLGAYVRFNDSLPEALREMAIILTARYWTAEFEWYAHKNAALAAGLDPAIVDAIAEGNRPQAMSMEEAALFDFCQQLLNDHRIGDETYSNAIDVLGEKTIVDIIGTVGYYSMVAMLLNTDEYPLPDGVAPELQPPGR